MDLDYIQKIVLSGIQYNAKLRNIDIPQLQSLDEAMTYELLYKNVNRLRSFIWFINGYYDSGESISRENQSFVQKSKRMTSYINSENYIEYCYNIYYFIVNNQIFGDGNHRTAQYIIDHIMVSFMNSNITREQLETFYSLNRQIDFTVAESNFHKWWDIHENLNLL